MSSSSPIILLETPRLYLRRFTAEDAPLLCELDSDPEVMRYITNGRATPLETIREEVLPRWLAFYEQPGESGFWAAHERSTDAFIGWFHLRPDRIDPAAMELGYRLRRAMWGKGYAAEGARALIERAFQAGAGAVTAHALAANTASRRVMEKCGLQLAGEMDYGAEILPDFPEGQRSVVHYRLDRAAYRPPTGSPS